MHTTRTVLIALFAILLVQTVSTQDGFTSLFNGKDFTGWKVPAGDNGHWRVVDGVIDYDAESEASGDKSLWSEREFGDFTLRLSVNAGCQVLNARLEGRKHS